MDDKKIKNDQTETEQFKGKFISATGRRKTAVAKVRLYKNGAGLILINNQKFDLYFPEDEQRTIVLQPLKLTGILNDFNFSFKVSGGGKKNQAEATRHGLARALITFNPDLKPALRAKGFLTRDARIKERKKPGLKKARRAPQWSKR